MEVTSRERLTGAVIFVTVFSIVASEMFSGRGEDAIVREAAAPAEAGPPLATYDLALNPSSAPASLREQGMAGDSATVAQAEPQPTAPEPAAPAPSPEPVAPVAVAPDTAGAATTKRDEATPKPAASPPAAGGWWVQLGSFSSAENAQRLARDLRARGFPVEVAPVKVRGRDLLGVRAGPVGDREAAAALKSRIGSSARDAILIAQ